MDEFGRHGLSCKVSAGWIGRHEEVNNLIHRALASALISSIREPKGLCRSDGKRPDGCTLVHWRKGKPLTWDFTCSDTFASSNVNFTARQSGAASQKAETNKTKKYSDIMKSHLFSPIAIETKGPWGKETTCFLHELASRLRNTTKEDKAGQYLFERVSIAVQRGNAISVLGTLPDSKKLDSIYYII